MPIHTPKLISSSQGLGLNTTKRMNFINDNLAIGTEIWGVLETPWTEGKTIIAQPGFVWITKWQTDKPYIITKFHNNHGELIGIYCDIARPVRRIKNGFEFDDMYLDVWQIPGQTPIILDEDELQQALTAGYITKAEADEAAIVAQQVASLLTSQPNMLDF